MDWQNSLVVTDEVLKQNKNVRHMNEIIKPKLNQLDSIALNRTVVAIRGPMISLLPFHLVLWTSLLFLPNVSIAWKSLYNDAFIGTSHRIEFNNAIKLDQHSCRHRLFKRFLFTIDTTVNPLNYKEIRKKNVVPYQVMSQHHSAGHEKSYDVINRKDFVAYLSSIPSFMIMDTKKATAAMTSSALSISSKEEENENFEVRVPLYYDSNIAAYVVYYRIGNDLFGGIVDTGSPFITVPSTSCGKMSGVINSNSRRWGCYREGNSQPSNLTNSYEKFANNEGYVRWRSASFAFDKDPNDVITTKLTTTTTKDCSSNNEQQQQYDLVADGKTARQSNNVIFGILSESLMSGSGGVFLGLIRDTNSYIRPSFLSQLKVRSFQIDLRNNEKSIDFDFQPNQTSMVESLDCTSYHSKHLTLSTNRTWIHTKDRMDQLYSIQLINELNRKCGDPVLHYTAIATSVLVNGNTILSSSTRDNKKRKIYVIFDTGVTGMVVSKELLEDRYYMALQNKEKNLWNHVEIQFPNKNPKNMNQIPFYSIVANKPMTSALGDNPWPRFPSRNSYLIVIGLSFLNGHQMTFELDQQSLWID